MATPRYFSGWLDEMNGLYHDHSAPRPKAATLRDLTGPRRTVGVITQPWNAASPPRSSARRTVEAEEVAGSRVLPAAVPGGAGGGGAAAAATSASTTPAAALSSTTALNFLRDTPAPRIVSPESLARVSHLALHKSIARHGVYIPPPR